MMSIEGSEEAASYAQEPRETLGAWNKSAVNDFAATSGYRTVAVLFIRWAEWLDPELHTAPEVASAHTMHEIAHQLTETRRSTSFDGSSVTCMALQRKILCLMCVKKILKRS